MDCTSFSRLTCWCLDMSWITPSSIWSGTWYILRYIVIAGDVARGCAQLLSTSLTVKIDGKKRKKKERNWGVFFLSFLFFLKKELSSKTCPWFWQIAGGMCNDFYQWYIVTGLIFLSLSHLSLLLIIGLCTAFSLSNSGSKRGSSFC